MGCGAGRSRLCRGRRRRASNSACGADDRAGGTGPCRASPDGCGAGTGPGRDGDAAAGAAVGAVGRLLAQLWGRAVAAVVPSTNRAGRRRWGPARLSGRPGRGQPRPVAAMRGPVRRHRAVGAAGQSADHSVVDPAGGAVVAAGYRPARVAGWCRALGMARRRLAVRAQLAGPAATGAAPAGDVVAGRGTALGGAGGIGGGVLVAAATRRWRWPGRPAAVPATAVARPACTG